MSAPGYADWIVRAPEFRITIARATTASVTEASIRLSWSGGVALRAGPKSGDVPAGAALN